MKKLELILAIITLIAIAMKLSLMFGGSSLASITMILLSLIYFPFGFAFLNQIPMRKIFIKNAYKAMTSMRIIYAIGVGLSFSAICLGILFKLNSWPGSNQNLIVGLVLLVIILVISLFRNIKFGYENNSFIFRRIGIISILGIIFLILPNLPIERIRFGNHPDYIKACEDNLNNPQNPELKEKKYIEYQKVTRSKDDFDMYMKYYNKTEHKK
jgi:hypothetical protein